MVMTLHIMKGNQNVVVWLLLLSSREHIQPTIIENLVGQQHVQKPTHTDMATQ
jgi:hypothetical protein